MFPPIQLIAILLLICSSCLDLHAETDPETSITIGHFSKGPDEKGMPPQWEELHFKRVKPTEYVLIQDRGVWVMKAESDSSASGLIHRFDIDPKIFPIVRWRWKVENLLEKSNLTRKSGDDHPARLYIGYEYDRSQFNWVERLFYWMVRLFYGKDYPSRAINYVWAAREPVGASRPNPYTRWVQTVVVASGEENLNEWVEIERNVYEDYQKTFGHEPPRITGIGIMTDSDNTRERAVAYYGDILFKTRRQTP